MPIKVNGTQVKQTCFPGGEVHVSLDGIKIGNYPLVTSKQDIIILM